MTLTYHNYKDSPLIAVDIETKDPELKLKGPGVYRKDGYVVGVSIANQDTAEYYPINHPDNTPEEKEKNRRYLIDQLSHHNLKCFANGIYDLDWLIHGEKIPVGGAYEDVQVAEPLLDEYRKTYSLNSLAEKYLGEQKFKDGMFEYARDQGWVRSEKDVVNHLWKMPWKIVAPYGAKDARLTFDIIKLQKEELNKQELMDVYNLEMRLYPLLLQMRRTGVRIDGDRLSKTGLLLADLQYDMQEEFNELAGFDINVNSGPQLEELFRNHGLPIYYSEPTERMIDRGIFRGNPSFNKAVLQKTNHPIAKKILELRHIKTLLNMFIHPYPELMVNGRLHGQFNQLRSDEFGTVSGRFSSSNPNLQQVSGKDESEHIHSDSEILNGQVIRKLFIPEDGCDWLKFDWSQIEYRLIAHYALGQGADTIRSRYNEDPDVDYHDEMGAMTGLEDRKIVKALNFGAAYGMGVSTMSATYGWDPDEAVAVYNNYHKKVPFVKETGHRVGAKAKKVGYIRTILNRRARLANPSKSYVMFNRLIQGSAADIMKQAMVDAYEAGVFNTLHPHLTVHDEMDSSMPKTKEGQDAGKELKRIMETCVELRVPIRADAEIGPNWGELQDWEV